jgi:4-hydroxybenzoate polyprenyltransferase
MGVPMPPFKPWLQLLHFGPSVFTTLAFAVIVALAARGAPPAGRLALLLAAQLLTQFAISLLNDVWDLPQDRVTRPDKPIPAGVVSAGAARAGGLACAVAALALALPLGAGVLAATAVGLAAGLLYDWRLKRTRWSPAPFAVGFGVLPVWAWLGVARPLDGVALGAALLLAWMAVALHLADTLPDLESDRAVGVAGLAHRLGSRATRRLCWAVAATGLLAALAAGIALGAAPAWLAATGLAGGGCLLAGILLYGRRGPAGLRPMAGLIEAGAMLTALGWLAACTL